MNKKLTFKKFLKEKGEKGIGYVAADYATLEDSVTIYVLSEKYNISKSAVRTCIRYAVVEGLVSYSVANKMKEKAHRNQIRHTPDSEENAVTTSDKYYDRLFRMRDSKICDPLKSQLNEIEVKIEDYKSYTPNGAEALHYKEEFEEALKSLHSAFNKIL